MFDDTFEAIFFNLYVFLVKSGLVLVNVDYYSTNKPYLTACVLNIVKYQ